MSVDVVTDCTAAADSNDDGCDVETVIDQRILITGVHDFGYQRLNVLQIGLGTFSTFVQNLTTPDEVYYDVKWMLSACSNHSSTILGVGVEPVAEHIECLQPALKKLRRSSLVQAAVGKRLSTTTIYAITPAWKNINKH